MKNKSNAKIEIDEVKEKRVEINKILLSFIQKEEELQPVARIRGMSPQKSNIRMAFCKCPNGGDGSGPNCWNCDCPGPSDCNCTSKTEGTTRKIS